MMKRRTWFGIVLAAVLALSVLLTGCGGDEEEKKALKFKTEMPEVIDFNVAFDVEEYLEYDAMRHSIGQGPNIHVPIIALPLANQNNPSVPPG